MGKDAQIVTGSAVATGAAAGSPMRVSCTSVPWRSLKRPVCRGLLLRRPRLLRSAVVRSPQVVAG